MYSFHSFPAPPTSFLSHVFNISWYYTAASVLHPRYNRIYQFSVESDTLKQTEAPPTDVPIECPPQHVM